MEYIENIVRNILIGVYQLLGASVLMSSLFMFFYMYVEDRGLKSAIGVWLKRMINEKKFRYIFFLVLYTSMVLFKTVLTRSVWWKPLSDIFGGWSIHNDKGVLATENIENVILFVPFAVMYLLVINEVHTENVSEVRFLKSIVTSVKVSFVASAIIEITQLLLKLGTFQFADLFYNTLGGLIGGVLFVVVMKVKCCFGTNEE